MAKTAPLLDLDRGIIHTALEGLPVLRASEMAGQKAAVEAHNTFSLKPPSPQMASFLKLMKESPEMVKFTTNIKDALEAATAPVEAKATPSMEIVSTRPTTAPTARPTGMTPTGPQ